MYTLDKILQAPPSDKKQLLGTSLVVQCLRIRLPLQGTQVQSLVWEDSTRRGATKPVRHNYGAHLPWGPCKRSYHHNNLVHCN